MSSTVPRALPTGLYRPFAVALVVACAALAAAAHPAVGAAAPGAGSVSMVVGKGKAARALAAADVRVGAAAPASKRGMRIVLPVRGVAVARVATVTLAGGLRLRAGGRGLVLRGSRLVLAPRRARLSVRAGKRRVVLLAAALPRGRARLDRSAVTARLVGAPVRLTPAGARLLRARLGLRRLAPGQLGRLAATARPRSSGPGSGDPGGQPSPGGPGAPRSGPIADPSPRLARPAGAVDVTAASLVWRPRESWIQYINGGQGTSAIGGAANGPAEVRSGSSAELVYSFHGFPFQSGWYHPPSGAAAIYFRGGVGFRWSGHGIDFSTSDPEIEIGGAASRAIFVLNGTESTPYADRRGVLVDLHPSPIHNPVGGEVVYADVPATVPADTGASVFAGFYPAHAPFGTISVSFTAAGL